MSDEHVEVVLPFVSRQVAAMIQLQRLTGMRPGEVVQIRPIDVDCSGEVWLYRPENHKTANRGPERKWWLQHPRCFQIPPGLATECAFSPDGKFLTIATSHSHVFVLNVRSREVNWGIREEIEQRLLESGTVTEVGWSISEHLVNGGIGHAAVVASLAFSADATLLVTGGDDKTVRVWDFQTGELRATLLGHNNSVVGVRFSHHSASRQTITFMDGSGQILIWSAATQSEVEESPEYWAARSRRHRDLGDGAREEADRIRSQKLREAEEIRDEDAFKELLDSGNWVEAAKIGLRILNANPDDAKRWLEMSPIIVLANDKPAYRDFCSRFAERFAETDQAWIAEHVCKASLIRPGAIDLDRLSHKVLAESLGEQTQPTGLAPWHWNSRALVAFRSGDPVAAINYVQESEDLNAHELVKMLNSAILSLAKSLDQNPTSMHADWFWLCRALVAYRSGDARTALAEPSIIGLVPTPIHVTGATNVTVLPRGKPDDPSTLICHLLDGNYLPECDSMQPHSNRTITLDDSLLRSPVIATTLLTASTAKIAHRLRLMANGSRPMYHHVRCTDGTTSHILLTRT